jgi:hypothetical protein
LKSQHQVELKVTTKTAMKAVKIIKTLSYGRVLVDEALWERIGTGKTLRDIFSRQKMSLLLPAGGRLNCWCQNALSDTFQ